MVTPRRSVASRELDCIALEETTLGYIVLGMPLRDTWRRRRAGEIVLAEN